MDPATLNVFYQDEAGETGVRIGRFPGPFRTAGVLLERSDRGLGWLRFALCWEIRPETGTARASIWLPAKSAQSARAASQSRPRWGSRYHEPLDGGEPVESRADRRKLSEVGRRPGVGR